MVQYTLLGHSLSLVSGIRFKQNLWSRLFASPSFSLVDTVSPQFVSEIPNLDYNR